MLRLALTLLPPPLAVQLPAGTARLTRRQRQRSCGCASVSAVKPSCCSAARTASAVGALVWRVLAPSPSMACACSASAISCFTAAPASPLSLRPDGPGTADASLASVRSPSSALTLTSGFGATSSGSSDSMMASSGGTGAGSSSSATSYSPFTASIATPLTICMKGARASCT